MRTDEEFAAQLLRSDPATAAPLLSRLPPGAARARATTEIFASWARSDPAAALAWAGRLPTGPERDAALVAATSHDPLAILDVLEKNRWQMDFLSAATSHRVIKPNSKNPPETVPASHGTLTAAVQRALSQLVKDGKPMEAVEMIVKVPDEHARTLILNEVVTQWMRSDARAAIDWLADAPESVVFSSWLADGLGRIAAEDGMAAAGTLLKRFSGPSVRPAVAEIIDGAARSGDPARTESLFSWAASLPGAERRERQNQIGAGLAVTDPSLAASYLLSLPVETSGDGAFGGTWQSLGHSWAARDPTAGARFFSDHLSEIAPSAVAALARTWLRDSLREASQWIGDLPPGPARDAAISPLVSHLTSPYSGDTDFEAALLWADEISDPEIQADAVRQITKGLDRTP
ncbi:hypothetical protein BH23VER1_BH23VER1_19900 [soil metagenome]